ncbi:MAG TPA: dihydrolipoamide acetyltransferase family protein, partial [Vicinamibacteria bacterium]
IFEISTDKVDAEIPSPAAGVLQEIRVEAGATVPINTVVAVIAAEGAAVVAPAAGPVIAPAATPAAAPSAPPLAAAPPPTAPVAPPPVTSAPPPPPVDYVLEGEASVAATMPVARPRADMTAEELRHTRSSPVVRKIAAEHNVDISGIPGTGISGRVTKQDILEHLEAKSAPPVAVSASPAAASVPATPTASVPPASPPRAAAAPPPPPSPAAPTPATVASKPAVAPGARVEVVPMSPIRRKTAEHMIASQRTSAHVATVFEIDMTRIEHLRHKHRAAYEERSGIKLTYMPFILKATVDALKAWPVLNASIDGDSIVYRKDINLGIAVALDWGLIVPVIHNADEKNLLGLARGVADLAERARAKKLKVDEVQGGTFTITNPGVFGSLFGTPIISQPQVAILGVGTIEKRPVVRDDAIAIRTMAYFALSFDHRLVDGSDADRFMAHLKKGLQEFDESGL